MTTRQVARRLLAYLRPYAGRFLAAFAFTIAISAVSGALPILVKWLTDAFTARDTVLITAIPLIGVGLFVVKGACRYAQAYLVRYVANRVIMDVRNQVVDHCLYLPVAFYTDRSTGGLTSRVVNDISLMREGADVAKDILLNGVTAVAMIGVVFYLDWRLSLVASAVLLVVYHPLVRAGRRLRMVSRQGQEEMATLSGLLHEALTGIRVVKTFGMEAFESTQFTAQNRRYFDQIMRGVRLAELISPLMEIIGAAAVVCIVWYGAYLVIAAGTTTLGTLLGFLAAIQMLYSAVRNVANANPIVQQTFAAAERVFELLDAETERAQAGGTYELTAVRQGIEFRDIHFRYGAEEILAGVNLTVRAGDVVAIVGTSGAGKTTFVNLLPRLYDPTHGTILIDGRDIREMTLASLRRQIGIVAQEIVLFSGTVRENIAYGSREVSMERVVEAARAAHAHHFIEQLPAGYDTQVGEQGVKFSRGERQRLAIARALLKNAPILILDEATSSLDTESEYLVQQALEALMKGRTTFIVAHRLSTVQHATTIVVLEGGRIVETGSHQELLRRQEAYYRLYSLPVREGP